MLSVSDEKELGVSDESELSVSHIPGIPAEDTVFCNSIGATDFFSAPDIDSREVLGAPDPLIQSDDSQQNCITEEKSAKPEAHFTITSRNIRNLLIHRQDVCDCEDNVQVLQECDLLEHQQSTNGQRGTESGTMAETLWQRS